MSTIIFIFLVILLGFLTGQILYRKASTNLDKIKLFTTFLAMRFTIPLSVMLAIWSVEKVDHRCLDELIELWFNLHGQALNDGKKRKNKLIAMSLMMRNPIAKNITTSDFSKYRQLRIQDVSIKTANNDQTYLNALFNELKRLGE
ncbi:phage integrase [Psychromonas arctica]|uniref:phage integrase n=1 Tax=Psychromonas arctica TaxID=168275 RepID=UPI000407ECBC|nr:hypothetical protein [Psychromonas arctica]